MIIRTVQLKLVQGLHIRACSRVVALVSSFNGQIRIRFGNRVADANSMFDLVQLAAAPGSELIVEGDGDGAEAIIDELEKLFAKTTDVDDP